MMMETIKLIHTNQLILNNTMPLKVLSPTCLGDPQLLIEAYFLLYSSSRKEDVFWHVSSENPRLNICNLLLTPLTHLLLLLKMNF